ncbi:hypothetical protein VL20_1490 [Microcystis panniformis FACHB-1757]|uniref:DUF7305 domain-containing protein n=1 Tax=Microcystis panniformis FACHB-1757 TaxID=1638788 RepID=A0A0K1RY77_9CHRO|nr:hypothetical protein VL20_1490 [Microcystis panniformis FACHB-1757]
MFFPNLPETPTGIPSLGDLTSSETFPRTGDTASPSGVYEYIVNNINLDEEDDEKITITAGYRVFFYVQGNINGAIEHNCGAKPDCKPGNLQIYAYSESDSAKICLRGDQRLQAFIFAPHYSLGNTGNGNFFGAAWGKNWGKISDCASTSGAVAVTQRVEWTELIEDLRPPFPQLGGIDNWCEEPIDTTGTSLCAPTASPSPSP